MTDAAKTEALALAGLDRPAEIRIDRWGIAHIRAETDHDVFFVQGFNAARDRLWQIDLWRKRGLGLLAADFGPGYLAQDHAARHFLYRGDMDAEWAAYAPDMRDISTAFAAGINAYIALAEADPARLPPEFAVFGSKPARWGPADVVRIRSHALTRNGISEILRANVMQLANAETDRLRSDLEPAVPVVAGDVDLADVPLAATRLFKLATAPVTFDPARLKAGLEDVWAWTDVTDLGEVVRLTVEEGSNNWAVHGSRTASGRPIVASDPHRTHAVPSLRYLVHLTGPGLDVIGTGEPSAPGVSLGHNDRVAFGLTIFGADQEDVYVYDTAPDDPGRYRYGDGWEAIERVAETFAVKGHPEQMLTLSFTRHGPVLHEDPARRRAVALRTVWSSPGAAAYLGSVAYMRARSVADFATALGAWGSPSVNHVAADVNGDIGWFTAGFTPIRRNWHGILPVAGDGRYEWNGFLAPEALPRSVNPTAGFVASANEMKLPPDRDPAAPSIGHEWAEVSRAQRIHAVLAADAAHSVEAAMALQTDVYSRPAAILAALAAAADGGPADARTEKALALFSGWDHCLDADSAPAALFELWWTRHLRPALLTRFVPDAAIRALLAPGDLDHMLALLATPEPRWPTADRDRLLLTSLAAAWSDAEARLGPDAGAWAWGTLHAMRFEHAAGRVGADAAWHVGPFPMGGSRSTAMLAGYRVGDLGVNSGASVRLVMDVGDWDASVCVNAPGQSGDPRSPHYGDLAEIWVKGGYVPLAFSADRVAEVTERRIVLTPMARAAQ